VTEDGIVDDEEIARRRGVLFAHTGIAIDAELGRIAARGDAGNHVVTRATTIR
jgi:hypothetical protein